MGAVVRRWPDLAGAQSALCALQAVGLRLAHAAAFQVDDPDGGVSGAGGEVVAGWRVIETPGSARQQLLVQVGQLVGLGVRGSASSKQRQQQ